LAQDIVFNTDEGFFWRKVSYFIPKKDRKQKKIEVEMQSEASEENATKKEAVETLRTLI
jgi:hypothetical protein